MALTKVMANEGGEHNILVNALLIDLIMSDQRVKRHAAQAPNMDFDEFANLACFLASEQGSYITAAINVDGGRSPLV